MCGLVGIFGKNLVPQQEKVFRDLLYLDTLRGEHSTGAAIVSVPHLANAQEEIEVFKEVGPAAALFTAHGKYQGKYALTNKTGIKALIGHNRYATQGSITADNAHPFELGNVVGAHNGTVPKYHLNKLHEASKFEVDSQIIYSHLGAGNSIDSVWEVADGAMALTWYDKVQKKMNFARNKERTLYLAHSKDQKILYWASEAWMLYIATSRNGIEEIEKPVLLEVDKLLQYSFDEKGVLVKEETPIPPFVRKPVVYTGYSRGSGYGFYDDWDEGWGNCSKSQVPPKNNVTNLKPLMKFVITEVVKGGVNLPFAFGKNDDKEDVRVNFRNQKAASQQINNILQRKRSHGVYITDKYHRLLTNGTDKVWVCDYNDLKFVKYAHLAEGFEGNTLTSDEWSKRVKCGCNLCQTVPSWKSKDTLRWVSETVFYCHDCKDIPWVKELESKYKMAY